MRNRILKQLLIFVLVISCISLSACSGNNKMKDGYYTAETAEYDHGWKEYVCILVKNGDIISVEFNAKNKSGFIKAWDNDYMRLMGGIAGTYPNEYTRDYGKQLIELQSAEGVDVVTGATNSFDNFEKLAAAVIEQAMKGNSEVVVVE